MKRLGSKVLAFAPLACWLIACGLFAQSQTTIEPAEELFNTTVDPKPGDRCIVCNTPLREGDKVYLVEGQRVGVMNEMAPTLFSDPWKYLARLKPRGGLFGGEMAPASAVSDAWLFLGIYVLVGLVCAALCTHRALNIGQAAIPWLFAGLFLNVFAYAALMTRPPLPGQAAAGYGGVVKIPSTAEPAACPQCGSLNHPTAATCLGCGAELSPATVSEVARLRAASN